MNKSINSFFMVYAETALKNIQQVLVDMHRCHEVIQQTDKHKNRTKNKESSAVAESSNDRFQAVKNLILVENRIRKNWLLPAHVADLCDSQIRAHVHPLEAIPRFEVIHVFIFNRVAIEVRIATRGFDFKIEISADDINNSAVDVCKELEKLLWMQSY